MDKKIGVGKILCFALILFMLSACSRYEAPRPVLIEPSAARTDTALADIGVVSSVTRRQGITRVLSEGLSFDIAGFNLSAVYVQHGDFVQEGQLLAQLDTSHIQEQITRQKERIALSRRNNARANEIRELEIEILLMEYTQMLNQAAEYIDEAAMVVATRHGLEVDRERMLLNQARERQALDLEREEEILRGLNNQLSGTELRAPFDGQITLIANHTDGMRIVPFVPFIYIAGEQDIFLELLDVYSIDAVQQLSFLPPLVTSSVRIHAHINGTVYALEYMPLSRDAQRFYSRNMPQSQSPAWIFPARFSISPVNGIMPPLGAYASIHFYREWKENVLRIPVNALFSEGRNFFVYVVEDGLLARTPIEIGSATGTFIEITGGLQEGDELFVRP